MSEEILEDLAVLLPAIQILEIVDECFEMATSMHASFNADVKERISTKPQGALMTDIALNLATANPQGREALRGLLKIGMESTRKLIENRREAALTSLSERDLKLLLRNYRSLSRVGSRSKRELERFYDALEEGDTGNLFSQIRISNGKPSIEVKFSVDP